MKNWKSWLVGLCVVGGLSYAAFLCVSGTVFYWQKGDHYEEASRYVNVMEPKVAEYAFDLAIKHQCLDAYHRGEIGARLRLLDDQKNDFVISGNLDRDSYNKVTEAILDRIGSHCRHNAAESIGEDVNSQSERMHEAILKELRPFDDLISMDRALNSLTWTYSGILWERSFSSAKPVSRSDFEEAKAKYAAIRSKMDTLVAKIGK